MKTVKILFFGLALVLGLSSCTEKFLEHELTGSTITQDELDQLGNTTYNRVEGLYSVMFMYGGDHQSFGQKSIDISTDILAADIALTNPGYGYWSAEAQGACSTISSGLTSYIWSHHYLIISNANKILNGLDKLGKENWSSSDYLSYAEATAMRAYSYFNLAQFFTPAPTNDQQHSRYEAMGDFNTTDRYPVCPLYFGTDDEYDPNTTLLIPKMLSPVCDVYTEVIDKLGDAIAAFQELEANGIVRSTKLSINEDVAKVMLAYATIQFGRYSDDATLYQMAYDNAIDVVNNSEFEIIPMDYTYEDFFRVADTTGGFTVKTLLDSIKLGKFAERLDTLELGENYDATLAIVDTFRVESWGILENGFNTVNDKSWMWGLDVTRENTTQLASFWGQMDIHTYSYASAGGILGIDQKLYTEIPETDVRKQWFNPNIRYAPENKFFDPNKYNPYLTGSMDGVDRNWLNDIVYMRVEEAYLLAAEAAYRLGNETEAREVLAKLLDERDTEVASQLRAGQGDVNNLLYYNWRVEMWGEGRALMTFKRFEGDKKRGTNHYIKQGADWSYTMTEMTFDVPYAEYSYNQSLQPNNEETEK